MFMNVLFFLLPKSSVVYVEEDYSIRQTLEKMQFHHYSAVPLLSKNGKYIATISEGDLLWYLKDNRLDFEKTEKINICKVKPSREIKPISINNDMDSLINLISNQNFVPVNDDLGNFIGIVRRSSIINYLVEKIKKST